MIGKERGYRISMVRVDLVLDESDQFFVFVNFESVVLIEVLMLRVENYVHLDVVFLVILLVHAIEHFLHLLHVTLVLLRHVWIIVISFGPPLSFLFPLLVILFLPLFKLRHSSFRPSVAVV